MMLKLQIRSLHSYFAHKRIDRVWEVMEHMWQQIAAAQLGTKLGGLFKFFPCYEGGVSPPVAREEGVGEKHSGGIYQGAGKEVAAGGRGYVYPRESVS